MVANLVAFLVAFLTELAQAMEAGIIVSPVPKADLDLESEHTKVH